MANNPTVTPIMTPATGPGNPLANPVYLVDQYGNALASTNAGPVSVPDITATGTISADQGAVTATFGAGVASWTAYLAGTFNAGTTIFFEGTIDGTNWIAINGALVGATADTDVSSVAGGASVAYQGNAAGMAKVRMRAHPFAGGDSVSVTIIGSVAVDGGFLTKSLPAGTALIGGVNQAQVAGTTTSVNAGNRDAGTQRFIESGNPTPTVTQVASAASDTSILAANANKKGTLFFNDSTAILYLLYGTGVASTTNYSVQVGPKAYFEDPLHYTGGFHGIWASANGFVYCTEVS